MNLLIKKKNIYIYIIIFKFFLILILILFNFNSTRYIEKITNRTICDNNCSLCINNYCISEEEKNNKCVRNYNKLENSIAGSNNFKNNIQFTDEEGNDIEMNQEEIQQQIDWSYSSGENYNGFYQECINANDCSTENGYNNTTGKWCINKKCNTTADLINKYCQVF